MIQSLKLKIAILVGIIALTVAIHYGLVLEHIFGHSMWVHALHSRFCYLPVVIAAAWFGVRGGLLAATAISALILPYLFGAVSVHPEHTTQLSQELIEVFFYYVIGFLIGWLVDRELRIRKQHQETQLALERSHHLSIVGQMAAGVAHEIKNPLASIKGAVEIICEDSTSPQDQQEFKSIISSEIKRIDGTVKEFLEYARPKEIKLESVNLSLVLQSSLKQMDRQVTDAGVCVRSEVDPDIFVKGDQEKLHQVILNLMLNAVEASPASGNVDVSLRGNGKNDADLIVRDYGRGITPAEINKVFEPFYTTKATGTGLGLAIVKSIVEQHGGHIQLTSPDDGGTQVCLSLPLAGEKAWQ